MVSELARLGWFFNSAHNKCVSLWYQDKRNMHHHHLIFFCIYPTISIECLSSSYKTKINVDQQKIFNIYRDLPAECKLVAVAELKELPIVSVNGFFLFIPSVYKNGLYEKKKTVQIMNIKMNKKSIGIIEGFCWSLRFGVSSLNVRFEAIFSLGTVYTIWTLECWHFTTFPLAMIPQIALFLIMFTTATIKPKLIIICS